jgi:hypothetical protein
MAVDKRRYRRGQGVAGEIETAHNFPRDIFRGVLRPMLGGVECGDANRVAVLAGHQIADDGFEVGLIDVGFRKCGPQVSEIVDDEIKGLIVTGRHNRRNNAPAHKKLQAQKILKDLSTNPKHRNRNQLPPTALRCPASVATMRAMSEIRAYPGIAADTSESARISGRYAQFRRTIQTSVGLAFERDGLRVQPISNDEHRRREIVFE